MTPTGYASSLHNAAAPDLSRILRSIRFVASPGPTPLVRLGTAAVDQRIGRVESMMHRHLSRKLTVAWLAREAGLSVSRLTHLFTSQVGIPPKQYLKCIRLLEAKELLEESRLNVKEVAGRIGLGSGAFIRQFQEIYGAPPGRWRQEIMGSRQEASFSLEKGAAGDESSRIGL